MSSLLVIIIFSLIGSYLVNFSRANSLPPKSWIEDSDYLKFYKLHDGSFIVDSFVDVPSHDLIGTGAYQGKVNDDPQKKLSYYVSFLKHPYAPESVITGYTCGTIGNCTVRALNNTNSSVGGTWNGFALCIDPQEVSYGKQYQLAFTVNMNVTDVINPYDSQSTAGRYYVHTEGIWRAGPCSRGDDNSNNLAESGGILQGILNGPSVDTRPGIGSDHTISDGHTTGNGLGTGIGANGGGSNANTQSQEPRTVPSSSGQGELTQTSIEPSPFFDGKQYEPGSDPDILGVNTTFSVAGHNLKYGWLVVVAVLLLGGGGGLFWWWKKRKSRLKSPS